MVKSSLLAPVVKKVPLNVFKEFAAAAVSTRPSENVPTARLTMTILSLGQLLVLLMLQHRKGGLTRRADRRILLPRWKNTWKVIDV